MTTRAENITQNDSANGGGGCLGGCVIGVSGAGSLCVHSLGLCMYVGGGVCMLSCIYNCTHWCTAMFVHQLEDQSLHDSVRDCDIHLFLIKETVANWSTMFRADYLCTTCHANFKFRDFFFLFKVQHLDRLLFFNTQDQEKKGEWNTQMKQKRWWVV